MNLSVTINEAVWQNRVDKFNTERKSQHDAAQASKKPEDRTEYVPVTVEEYAKQRVSDIETSYSRQIEEEELAGVREDPVQYKRLIFALTDPQTRQEFAEIIDSKMAAQG